MFLGKSLQHCHTYFLSGDCLKLSLVGWAVSVYIQLQLFAVMFKWIKVVSLDEPVKDFQKPLH